MKPEQNQRTTSDGARIQFFYKYILEKCLFEADEESEGQVAVKHIADEPENKREETKAAKLYSMKDFNCIAH